MRNFGQIAVRAAFVIVCLLGALFAAHSFIGRASISYRPLATGLAVVGVLAVVYSEFMLVRIVRFEYEHHRASWLEDDCPRVSFWGPDDHRASYGAGKRVRWQLVFRTPGWVGSESWCAGWLKGYRIGWLVSTFCFLTFFIFVI